MGTQTSEPIRHLVSSVASNLAYMVFGFALIWHAPKEAGELTLVLAFLAQLCVGVFSTAFHLTYKYDWQKLDMLAIVWLFIVSIAYNAAFHIPQSDWWLALLAVTACVVVFPFRHKIKHWHVGTLALSGALLIYLRAGYWEWMLAFYAGAFVCTWIGNQYEEGTLWYDLWHGFPWHGLSATAIYVGYL